MVFNQKYSKSKTNLQFGPTGGNNQKRAKNMQVQQVTQPPFAKK